jgi:hypothetical protein
MTKMLDVPWTLRNSSRKYERRREVEDLRGSAAAVSEENAWWRENRDIKTLFAQEFLATIRHIQRVPGAGPVYVERRGRAIRKWLMPKTRCHIYYRVVPEQVPLERELFEKGSNNVERLLGAIPGPSSCT